MEIPPAWQTKSYPPLHRGALISSPTEHLHISLDDKPRPAHYLQVGVFNCCKEEGWTSFISIHGLVSPERTKEHRQVVKRSGTPAMCIKVNRVPEVRRKNLIICPSPPRGSVVGCVLSRGSVLRTSPPACVLSCLRHFSFLQQNITEFFCRYQRIYCFLCIAFGYFQKRIC